MIFLCSGEQFLLLAEQTDLRPFLSNSIIQSKMVNGLETEFVISQIYYKASKYNSYTDPHHIFALALTLTFLLCCYIFSVKYRCKLKLTIYLVKTRNFIGLIIDVDACYKSHK